jgi:hypothetical protein
MIYHYLSSFIIVLHCCIGQIMLNTVGLGQERMKEILDNELCRALGGVTEVSKPQPDAVSENDTTSVTRCYRLVLDRDSWNLEDWLCCIPQVLVQLY